MIGMLDCRPQGRLGALFSAAALAGAMLAAGIVSEAQASIALPNCDFGTRCSHVTDNVVDNGNGTWTYNFTVYNDSVSYAGVEPRIRDWELPYFGDAGITNITSITSSGYGGWAWTIETVGFANPSTGWDGLAAWQDPSDPWYQGASSPFTSVQKVLHWYTNDFPVTIAAQSSLGGFGFTADFAPTAAPYQASWVDFPVRTGDPAFPFGAIPNSPAAGGASVPEPATTLLIGLGVALLAGGTLRRRARH